MFPLIDTDRCASAAPTSPRTATSTRRSSATPWPTWRGRRACRCTRTPGSPASTPSAAGSPRVHTDRGSIDCETVVNCGGMFAAEIGRMLDVRIPLVPMSHQYVVTDAFLERRDQPAAHPARPRPARLLPAGGRRPGDGRLRAARRAVDRRRAGPTTRSRRTSTAGCCPRCWDRFEEITANSQRAGAGDGRRRAAQDHQRPGGVHARTTSSCLGETDVDGFFVAAGFCAHGIAGAGGIGKVMAEWIVSGDPGMDLWHMDVRRFGAQYRSPSYTLKRTLETYETYYDIVYPGQEREAGRPLRTPPAYAWHVEHGASFGEKSGWERVNYYESNAGAGDEALRPRGWAGRLWSPAVGVEHRATREAVGAVRRVVVRQADGDRPGRRRPAAVGVRQRRRARRRRHHLHPGAQRARRHRVGLHRDPAWPTTRSWSSPGRRSARTTWSWLRRQARRRDADGAGRRRHRPARDVRAVGAAQPRRAACS